MPLPECTGERVVPGLVDADLLNEHLARYRFAARFSDARNVLDAGCGSGYGSAELARAAAHVTGIDSSADAIDFAASNFHAPNLSFYTGDCTALPTGPFDLIVAFEVIEHLADWRALLREARRALAVGGSFFVSTPNKLYYAESRGEAGSNPFHLHEFEYAEFVSELQSVFPHVQMYLQNHVEAVAFTPVSAAEKHTAADFSPTPPDPQAAHFFLAICSLQPLLPFGPYAWLPGTGNLLREREHHIRLLSSEVAAKTDWLERSKNELDTRNREYEELLHLFRRASAQVEQRNQWALQARAESDQRGARILELQQELLREQKSYAQSAAGYEQQIEALEEINRAKTEWAQQTEHRLTAELQQRANEYAHCVALLDTAEGFVTERTLWAQSLQREVESLNAQLAALRSANWVKVGSRLKLVPEQR